MRFALFIFVNALLFIRPVEAMPWLGDFPVYEWSILSCLILSLPSIFALLRASHPVAPPVLACALGLLLAIPLSDAANGLMAEAFDHTLEYFKVMVYLILLVSVVNTAVRVRAFVFWIGIFSALTAGLATVQYHGAIEIPRPEKVEKSKRRESFVQEKFRDPSTGQMVVVQRMCGTGLFNDPNDLGLLLVAGIPIALFFLSRREGGMARFFWVAPLCLFLYALVLTQSRGSFLAMLISLGVLFILRYGRRKSIIAGAAMFPLLLVFFAGRMTDLSASAGTGQSRIHLWSDGMLMFRESPIWGVGMHQFASRARLVAHNSFIHCFAELGFLGGGLFFSAFLLTLVAMIRLAKNRERIEDPEMQQLFPYVMALLVAFLVGILFLSRSYVVPTYTILGLLIAYLRLAAPAAPSAEPAPLQKNRLVLRPLWTMTVASIAFLMAAEAFIRVFAR